MSWKHHPPHYLPEVCAEGPSFWGEKRFQPVVLFVAHSVLILLIIIVVTSSTAQGGGGSFKNRKPIGEVGCCESRMAERTH
jgi:hypothetical protein